MKPLRYSVKAQTAAMSCVDIVKDSLSLHVPALAGD
jgi:hypothetical protein